jgi:hypothetical protein
MPYVLLNRHGNAPIFTIDHGVGKGMANQRKDVALIQYFLKNLLYSHKMYGRGVTLWEPKGIGIDTTGIWGREEANFLNAWEELIYAPGHGTFNEPAPFPGTVVSTRNGGQKINEMNQIHRVIFGEDRHKVLDGPYARLPDWVREDLFYK